MTRIIGTQTTKLRWDYYDYDQHKWFRREVVEERELHATKGWKAPRRVKSLSPISFREAEGPHRISSFKRW